MRRLVPERQLRMTDHSPPLKLVRDVPELRRTMARWGRDMGDHRDTARSLLRQTSYWVYDPTTDVFGPSKFVAYTDMDFARYEAARQGHTSGAKFDGNVARRGIEGAVGLTFKASADLEARLVSWAGNFEVGALDGIDRSKWKFVSLEEAGVAQAVTQTSYPVPSAPARTGSLASGSANWMAAKSEIRDVLTRQARANEPLTYTDLVGRLKTVELEPFDPRLFRLLGEVSSEEAVAGRGMLSAFVVHRSGDQEPGPGFFELAQELGRNVEDRLGCWVRELKLAHEAARSRPTSVAPAPVAIEKAATLKRALSPRRPATGASAALTRLVEPAEIAVAQERFCAALTSSATRSDELALGWKGGGTTILVHWIAPAGIWFITKDIGDRWWNGFGLGDPFAEDADKSLVLEVNPSKTGGRRSAGAFLRDPDGGLHVAHSGRVGGGRPGVNRRAFVAYCKEHAAHVPATRDGFVIGRIDEELPDQLAAFVRVADAFKRAATAPGVDATVKVQRPRCPFCRDDVEPGTGTGCSLCMAWSHAACREEHGGCAACGAIGKPQTPK